MFHQGAHTILGDFKGQDHDVFHQKILVKNQQNSSMYLFILDATYYSKRANYQSVQNIMLKIFFDISSEMKHAKYQKNCM